jgi:hypothetical protein
VGYGQQLREKEGDDEDATETVRVVIYRNLQKAYSLTTWAQEKCGEDAGQTDATYRTH